MFRRSRTPPRREQGVVPLRWLLDRRVTVGGRTALEQLGYAHYLPAEMREVRLYGPEHPPTWLASPPLDAASRRHNSPRLFPSDADTDQAASGCQGSITARPAAVKALVSRDATANSCAAAIAAI